MAASVERSKAVDFASGKSDTQALPIDEDDFRRAESSEDVTDNEKSAVSSADESGTKSDEDENVQDKTKSASSDLSEDKPKGNGDLFVHLDTNAAEVVKSDGLRRERKQVERFAHIPVKHEEKSTVILPGSGCKLGEITYIVDQINKRKATDLTNLHRFFYDRRGTTAQIKKNLRLFSGFPFDDKSPECSKKKKHLEKWGTKIIRDISDVLGVKRGTKEQMVERIMEFCLQPADNGMKIATKSKSKKSRSSTSKPKKSPSKSKKSKPGKSEAAKTKEKGTKRKLTSDSDNEEIAAANEEKVKEPPKKKSRDGSSRKASQNKLYLEEDEESEERLPSESESDFHSEEEKKKPLKKPRTPVKVKPKASSSKKSTAKKPSKSKIPKDVDMNETDSDDAPLINSKPTLKIPTDEDLKKSVQGIIEKADLKKVSMRMVVDDVFAEYPGVDLQNKKQFIKSLVQEML